MKSKLFWGSAIFCCAMVLGLISCSDDDNNSESNGIKVEETIARDGISTDFFGGIYQIAVTGGSWTASVPEADDWVNVVKSKGNSGEEISLLVEGQYEGISRNTILTVKSGENTIAIPIKQVVNKENEEKIGVELAANKGLGFGYNVDKYQKTGNTVFNIAAIDAVKEAFPIRYSNIIQYSPRSELKPVDAVCDSVELKHDSLNIKISVNISYGKFKMGIKGTMIAGEQRNTYANSVNMSANYPLYEASINVSGILSAYTDWVEEGKPEATKDGKVDYRGYMLTSKFFKKVNSLNELAEDSEVEDVSQDTKMKNLCADIVSAAGSAVIIQTTQLGGSYLLKWNMDSTYTNEIFNVDKAKATAEIKAAVFSLDAQVDVDYEKQMEETLKHCNFEGILLGGEISKQQAVYNGFQKNPGNVAMKDSIAAWSKSLKMEKGDNNSNVELINVECVGVWDFLERSAARYMKQYVKSLKKYKDSEVVKNLLIDDEEEE